MSNPAMTKELERIAKQLDRLIAMLDSYGNVEDNMRLYRILSQTYQTVWEIRGQIKYLIDSEEKETHDE